jgi:hypothetical protein
MDTDMTALLLILIALCFCAVLQLADIIRLLKQIRNNTERGPL